MITDINGVAIGDETEQDDELGTILLSAMVACTIQKDDTFYKLKLHWGTTTYEVRIPALEFNEEVKKQTWTNLLQEAFLCHELGKKFRSIDNIKV